MKLEITFGKFKHLYSNVSDLPTNVAAMEEEYNEGQEQMVETGCIVWRDDLGNLIRLNHKDDDLWQSDDDMDEVTVGKVLGKVRFKELRGSA